MKTIGIIGGIGPESTIDYYRSIIALYRERKKDGHYPHVIINSVDLTEMLELLESNRLEELTQAICRELECLAEAGADFAVFASNTPHLLFDDIQKLSPIPLLSIVEETCKRAKKAGLKKLGLVGTRFTMRSGFYQEIFHRNDITIVVPDLDQQDYIHDKYMNELVAGLIVDETKQEFMRIAEGLKDQHTIQGLILGGTELPLMLKNDDDIGIPFLNTSQIHVESIIDYLG
jgi:aspartate racemase